MRGAEFGCAAGVTAGSSNCHRERSEGAKVLAISGVLLTRIFDSSLRCAAFGMTGVSVRNDSVGVRAALGMTGWALGMTARDQDDRVRSE